MINGRTKPGKLILLNSAIQGAWVDREHKRVEEILNNKTPLKNKM